jgi:hypothetical protein
VSGRAHDLPQSVTKLTTENPPLMPQITIPKIYAPLDGLSSPKSEFIAGY